MPYKNPEDAKKYQAEYRAKNREKAKETTRNWAKSDHGRNITYRNRYGITIEQYNEMLENQNNVCAICKRPERKKHKGKTKRLSVDHCHNTGKVRGLLCDACNTSLGKLEDNPEIIKAMLDYLYPPVE